jgi:glycosyltransferase involved in cell wall biosynthesis
VVLQFVGRVSENYREMIEGTVLNAVTTFIEHVGHANSIAYLQNADALFLAIPDMPQNEGILTGKLFEYLAACKPIIAIGPLCGDASQIISECNAGSMFDYSDEESMGCFLNHLYLSWKESPYSELQGSVYRNYSREKLTEKLVQLIPFD